MTRSNQDQARARPVPLGTHDLEGPDLPKWTTLVSPRTAENARRFIRIYKRDGRLRKSAAKAGLGRKSLRKLQTHPDFRELVMDAHQFYVEKMEKTADNRAMRGVREPVFYEGEVCGHKRKYSDGLLQFRLRGLAPEKYAESHRHHHTGDVDHHVKVYIPDNKRRERTIEHE